MTLRPSLRLISSSTLATVLASVMLRSASDIVPAWRERASVSACSGFSSRVAVLPMIVLVPSFSFGAWSIARTRMLVRMISALTISGNLSSRFFSRLERITSTRSFGRMKPPAPVSGEISVEMARKPLGRIAAMKPEPLALISFGSRIGSPVMNRARDRSGDLLDGVCLAGFADEAAVGGCGRPALPLHVVGLDRLAEANVRFCDENINRRHLRDWLGRNFGPVGSAGKICGNAASADGDGQDDNACGIHTLHFPHYAATLLSP